MQLVRELFMRRVDAWVAADLDAYMNCWADDMVIELPSGRIEGEARYRKLVQAGSRGGANTTSPGLRRSKCVNNDERPTACG